MTHEGRMERGKKNYESGKKSLLDNADTKYFLENKPKDKPKPKETKEKVKENGSG